MAASNGLVLARLRVGIPGSMKNGSVCGAFLVFLSKQICGVVEFRAYIFVTVGGARGLVFAWENWWEKNKNKNNIVFCCINIILNNVIKLYVSNRCKSNFRYIH